MTRGEFLRRRRRRNFRRGLIFLVILVVAGYSVRPAYRLLERWRARALVRQGEELARQQLFGEAIEKLETALRLDSANARALRGLSEVYSRFELPSALPLYRALASLPESTDEDRHEYIAAALRLQRFDLAESELARLLARTNISTQTRTQATEYFFRLGDMKRALTFADQIRNAAPSNNLNHLRVAKILLHMGSTEDQVQALNVLQSLDRPDRLERLNMLEMLANAPALPLKETQTILARLPTTADSSPGEHFLRAEILGRLDPKERGALIAAAVERYRAGTSDQQAELILWLNRMGEHLRVLETWRPEDLAKHAAPIAGYLESMTRARRWAELQKAVASPLPIDVWLLEALRAQAATQLAQPSLAEEHWRRAHEQTTGNPARLRALGETALRLGATEQAVIAFENLTKDRLHRATGFRRLAQIHERSRDATRLRLTMQAWSASVPDDPVPENAYCYLSALLALDVEDAYQRARLLFERQPSRLTHRLTLAFLEFRRNNPREALQYLERARPPGQIPPPMAALVEGLILEANGQSARAAEAIKSLTPASLLPEEQELLRRLQAKTKG